MMTTINKITKDEYPLIFDNYFEFAIGETYHQHRRGSNYFTQTLLKFDSENLPKYPELHGFWESNVFVNDHEYGPDVLPSVLFRVISKTKIIQKVYYERVSEV
jgi:hypothetical protein